MRRRGVQGNCNNFPWLLERKFWHFIVDIIKHPQRCYIEVLYTHIQNSLVISKLCSKLFVTMFHVVVTANIIVNYFHFINMVIYVSMCIFTFTTCWLTVLLSYFPKPSQPTNGLGPHLDTLPKIKIHVMFYCDCPWGNGKSHRHCCMDFIRIILLFWLLIRIKVLLMLITWRHRRCWVLIIKRKNLINRNYIY